jgi:anti-sigma F factor
MNDTNEMSLEFMSKSCNEGFARVVVAAFAAQLDPTIEEIADIKTAVSEAVTNAIIHGYENGMGMIRLFCKMEHNIIEITISDKGVGIPDIGKAMEPLYTTRPEWERSGMGFAFMEAFMDDLEVTSEVGSGTTVKMKKIIRSVVSS